MSLDKMGNLMALLLGLGTLVVAGSAGLSKYYDIERTLAESAKAIEELKLRVAFVSARLDAQIEERVANAQPQLQPQPQPQEKPKLKPIATTDSTAMASDGAQQVKNKFAPIVTSDVVWKTGHCFSAQAGLAFDQTVVIKSASDDTAFCWTNNIMMFHAGAGSDAAVKIRPPSLDWQDVPYGQDLAFDSRHGSFVVTPTKLVSQDGTPYTVLHIVATPNKGPSIWDSITPR